MAGVEPSGAFGLKSGRKSVTGVSSANLPSSIMRMAAAVTIGLEIEAAMAFGTGHHGTTLGCLRAYDRLLDDGQRFDNVLDLGCGTAVLAMSAARMGAAHVLASDIDPVAVEVALANVKANGLVGRVACVESIGFDSPVLRAGAPFDLIFANILKGPLIELAPDIAAHLAPGGRAILSGLLVEQADDILEVYRAQGLALAAVLATADEPRRNPALARHRPDPR